jgi:hypothetical protein
MPPPTPRQPGSIADAGHHMTPTNSQTSRRVPGDEVTPTQTQHSRRTLAEYDDDGNPSDEDIPAPHTLIEKSKLAAQKRSGRRHKQQREPQSDGELEGIDQDYEDEDEGFQPPAPKDKTVAIRVSHRSEFSYIVMFLTLAIDRFLERLRLKRLRT